MIIAFLHTYEKDGRYVAGYENARGTNAYSGEDDAARIDRLVRTARAKNPDIKILLPLGWGNNDVGNVAKTPDVTEDIMLTLTKSLRRALTSDNLEIPEYFNFVMPALCISGANP